MKTKSKQHSESSFQTFEDNDLAMEWCENRLLEEAAPGAWSDTLAERADYELFHGLSADEISQLDAWLQRRSFHRGQIVVQAGDDADYLYLVAQGRASVLIESPSGTRKRLATFSSGMTFGEMAVTDQAPRSATVVADTDLVCDLLTLEGFSQLTAQAPSLKIKLLENLCLSFCRKLRKTNRELMFME